MFVINSMSELDQSQAKHCVASCSQKSYLAIDNTRIVVGTLWQMLAATNLGLS